MKDYYKILQISPDASREVIEKVYKILAKQYHPDMNSIENRKWAEEKFKEINEAYEVLSDDVKRRIYDIERENELLEINRKYHDILEQNENLKNQLGNLRENNNISQYSKNTYNKNNKKTNNSFNINYVFSVLSSIKDSIAKKSLEERKKDFISLILTIIVVSTILFILWHIEPLREFFYKI